MLNTYGPWLYHIFSNQMSINVLDITKLSYQDGIVAPEYDDKFSVVLYRSSTLYSRGFFIENWIKFVIWSNHCLN